MQADLNRNADEIKELRNRLAETESAASKAKKDLQVSLKTAEDLKKFFEEERTTFEVQKKELEKRVQDAEGALNPVTKELTGLKQQIELMTSAIFGKYNLNSCFILVIFHLCRFNRDIYMQGAVSPILGMTYGRNLRHVTLWSSSCIPALRESLVQHLLVNRPPRPSKARWKSCLFCQCV